MFFFSIWPYNFWSESHFRSQLTKLSKVFSMSVIKQHSDKDKSMKNTHYIQHTDFSWHQHVTERLSVHIKAQSWWGNTTKPCMTEGFEPRSWQFGSNYFIQQENFTAESNAIHAVISGCFAALEQMSQESAFAKWNENIEYVSNICLKYLQHSRRGQ